MTITITPEQKAAIVAEHTAALRAKQSEGLRRAWANRTAEQRSAIMSRIARAGWRGKRSKEKSNQV